MEVRDNCKKPYGITPAAMTIWDDNGEYDAKREEKYLTWLIDNGAHTISFMGSTGENKAMNIDQQKQIIDHVTSFIAGEVPLIAGTGYYNTKDTIEVSKYADEKGCDGVMCILPYYFTPYNGAVMRHYREIRKAISCRLMVYNNPHFTGVELSPIEVKELVEEGTVQDIKAAHGDPNRVHELKYHCGDALQVFYGHDYCAPEGLLAGADGWLSGFPAVLTKQCRAIWDAAQTKDVDATFKAQAKIQDYIDYFFYGRDMTKTHWLEVCHYTLCAQGVDAGIARLPLADLDADCKKKIDQLLADME